MEEKEECGICEKEIDQKKEGKAYWIWAEDPAHMECVFNKADTICEDCQSVMIADDDMCLFCPGKTRPITEKDKDNFRKQAKK